MTAALLVIAARILLMATTSAPQTAGTPSVEDPNRLAEKAQALLKEDLYEDARADLASALERWPDHAPLHVTMADTLYRRGDFDEADRHYRLAVEKDANLASAHFGVGRVLRTLGRYGEAAGSFSRAAALDPEVPRYLRILANHLARREDSLAMLRRYLQLARQQPGVEEESMILNVEAWVALLAKMGDTPLSEMVRAEPCTVPLQVASGRLHVKMRVGGLKNQRFVFDTGATGLTISPRIASRLKLTPIRPFTISGTGARGTETGELVVIPEIALGVVDDEGKPGDAIVVRNVPATIRDPAGTEEGLIGPAFFSMFDVTVEMKKARLTFETQVAERPGRTLKFRNVGGQILITAMINGIPFNAMVDTGADSTIVGKTTVGRVPGLQVVPARWQEGATVGIGGALADRKRILKGSLSFAGRDYTAAGLLSGNLSGFSRALESEVYIMLGAQHLRDTPFTISYREMTVTFADGVKQGIAR